MSVATTRLSLTGADWTDLGPGPLQMQAIGAPLTLAIADTKPAAGDPGFLASPSTLLVLQTASHVWAKTSGGAAVSGGVTLAPVSSASGGGSGGAGGAVTIADGGDVAQGTTSDAAGANSVIGQLKGVLVKLGATVLGAGSAIVGKVGIDQTSPGVSNGVVANAGENHVGEVGGNSAVAIAAMTRPANTTAYAATQLVANATAAGSVVPLALTAARKTGGTGRITRVRLSSSNAVAPAATFRVHLFKTAPTTTVGDGGVFNASNNSVLAVSNGVASVYLGYVDVTFTVGFADGAKGFGSPNGPYITFDAATGAQTLYALLEARSAYTPASGETFTLALEADRD